MGPSARGANDALAPILTSRRGVALLVGNGINRYANDQDCSWEDLLERISQKRGVKLSKEELSAMSNTERFDILDIAKPMADRSNLKQMFCDLMRGWHHGPHHTRIVT